MGSRPPRFLVAFRAVTGARSAQVSGQLLGRRRRPAIGCLTNHLEPRPRPRPILLRWNGSALEMTGRGKNQAVISGATLSGRRGVPTVRP